MSSNKVQNFKAVVYWLRQMAHDQETVGSNPGTVYWMDASNASYYIKEKLKIKVAKWGTSKKNFKVQKFYAARATVARSNRVGRLKFEN
jgi:hypothetical protein